LKVLASTAHLGGVAFIYELKIFPVVHTFVCEHLDKGIETPIVKNCPIEILLALNMLLHNHLPLGKITHNDGSLNHSLCDKMGSLMKTIPLLTLLLARDAFVHLAQVLVASRLLLTFVSFRADLVELAVIPLSSLEATHAIDPPLFIDPCCQCLDPQIKGNHAISVAYFFRQFCHKRSIIVVSGISTNGNLFVVLRWLFSQFCFDIGTLFVLAFSSSRQFYNPIYNLDLHGWITQCKKAMPWAHSGKPCLLAIVDAAKERFHGSVETKVHLM
jgi:hypothetical protein